LKTIIGIYDWEKGGGDQGNTGVLDIEMAFDIQKARPDR